MFLTPIEKPNVLKKSIFKRSVFLLKRKTVGLNYVSPPAPFVPFLKWVFLHLQENTDTQFNFYVLVILLLNYVLSLWAILF